ncbi:hypothetical protein [Pasteuria penetrans]|uniref:hypothetical protein n=1 Tax=Pasteuria penetrans TaxID=86005 RepID=UPI000FAFB3EE|nr:hypothetical protein [Pasteuria penetrans]
MLVFVSSLLVFDVLSLLVDVLSLLVGVDRLFWLDTVWSGYGGQFASRLFDTPRQLSDNIPMRAIPVAIFLFLVLFFFM